MCHIMVLLSSNPTWLLICLRVKAKILTVASKSLHDLPAVCSFHHWLDWSHSTSLLQLLWPLCCLNAAKSVPSV